MGYVQYQDQFGRVVEEGIQKIIEIEVTNTNVINTTEYEVFGFVVKRLPVLAKIKVNGDEAFTIDEGDKISPFVYTVDELQIVTSEAIVTPIIIQLLI